MQCIYVDFKEFEGGMALVKKGDCRVGLIRLAR
ncbi:MAG: hypothetical protein IPI42_16490 [Saprospiraceae bacterium]|nr:hypothetical protein [Candidatus Parvibacillus calidus]